jgi:hypothetical protein
MSPPVVAPMPSSTPSSASTPSPASTSSTCRPAARALRAGALTLVASAACWLAPSRASAQGVLDGARPRYSPYEEATIRSVSKARGLQVDPYPEGKLVESIEVVRLEVIEDRDPVPNFLNVFHATSRPFTLEREVLLEKGRLYSQDLADETARNLRLLPQISLVLVLPMRGSRVDRVRVVVVTKDVWSLRLGTDVRITSQGLEFLYLAPSETNLGGSHQTLGAQFTYLPETLSFGLRYAVPRIGQSWLRFSTESQLIFNQQTGALEGSTGSFSYGQPLYRIATEWAWGASIAWRQELTRRYVGVRVARFDAEATPERVEGIPFRYRSDVVVGNVGATRSFGTRTKLDVSAGIDASRRNYTTDASLSLYDPAAADEFRRRFVPVSDQRVAPYLQLRTYQTRFARLLNHNTLALQEDLRLGHDAYLRVYPAFADVGSSRDVVGVAAGALFTMPIGTGFTRLYVESINELEPKGLADGSFDLGFRATTPTTPIGRLHFDSRLLLRYANYLNRISLLGGDTRLRGYPSQEFLGKDLVVANLELRSRPLEILSCQLAAVAFFDVGDAFDGMEKLRIKQSAGFGLRLLLPQVNKIVMRADWGFPLSRDWVEPDDLPGDIVITFEQAFDNPSLSR